MVRNDHASLLEVGGSRRCRAGPSPPSVIVVSSTTNSRPGAEERAQHTGDDARRRILAGIPVAERRLRVAGVSTTVLEGGDGPPLVLLHGGIECGGAYWAPVMTRLADAYRLVVPDVPGLGESEPLARMDEGAFADWFAALVHLTCDETTGARCALSPGQLLCALRRAAQRPPARARDLRRAGDRALPNAGWGWRWPRSG